MWQLRSSEPACAACPPRCRRTARAPICIILSLFVPTQLRRAPTPARRRDLRSSSPSGAGLAGATARAARKQNWGCDEIEPGDRQLSYPHWRRRRNARKRKRRKWRQHLNACLHGFPVRPGLAMPPWLSSSETRQRHRPAERPAAGKGMRDIRYRRRRSRVPKALDDVQPPRSLFTKLYAVERRRQPASAHSVDLKFSQPRGPSHVSTDTLRPGGPSCPFGEQPAASQRSSSAAVRLDVGLLDGPRTH